MDVLIQRETKSIRQLTGCPTEGEISYRDLMCVKQDPTLQELVWNQLMQFYSEHAPLQQHYCEQLGDKDKLNQVLCALSSGVYLYIRK
jgi:hypothetical protein